MTSPKPKRKPAGAAVPGAVDRPTLYPVTVVAMVTAETKEAIVRTAEVNDVKQAVVARDWLEAGRTGAPASYADASRVS